MINFVIAVLFAIAGIWYVVKGLWDADPRLAMLMSIAAIAWLIREFGGPDLFQTLATPVL